MNRSLLAGLFILGASVTADALVKESEKSIVESEIVTLKKKYESSTLPPEELKRMLDEERKERNNKIKAVVKVAKETKLPAGLFLDAIQDGVVVPELLEGQDENLKKWKKARRSPRELQMPWGNIFFFVVLLLIAIVAVIIHRGKKKMKTKIHKPTF